MNGIVVKSFSKAKDGSTKLSDHFKVQEFACSDGTDAIFIAPNLVNVLEAIRTHFNKPVYINSAYRTAAKNKQVGGATYSQHMYGTAADIVVGNKTTGVVPPKDVAAFANTLMPNSGGIGIYPSFCHVDVRKVKSRWTSK